MQPMNRHPGPPFDPRNMGHVPAGIPPQLRAPMGFTSPQMPPAMGAYNLAPSGPPIQKMANMSLGVQGETTQERPDCNQMNSPLINGVPNTRAGVMPQHMSSFNDPNLSSNVRQENVLPELTNLPAMGLSEEQAMKPRSPAILHGDSRSSPNSFPTDSVIQPLHLSTAAQAQQSEIHPPHISLVSQPEAFLSQPSTMGMPIQSGGPIMSPNLVGPGIQRQASPGITPSAGHGSISESSRMPQNPMSGIPQLNTASMPQPHGPSMSGISPVMPPYSGSQMTHPQGRGMPPYSGSHMTHPQGRGMPQTSTGMNPLSGSLMTQRSPMPSPGILQRPGYIIPQPHEASIHQSSMPAMSQPIGPRMPQPPIHRMPQTHEPPRGPYGEVHNNPPEPRMGIQGSQLLAPGQKMSPHPYGTAMTPQSSGPIGTPEMSNQNFLSPAMRNQTKSPHMPPGTSDRTPTELGIRPGSTNATPGGIGHTHSYSQSGSMNSFSGQPGAPPMSGMSPRMPPQPGMMSSPGMPPPPGSMSTPGMPPPGSMPAPGMPPPGSMRAPGMPPPAGQQQYAAQQGGMQNRYPGSNAQSPGMGGYAQGQGRKLNPDDMPSPLQVIEEDIQSRSGEFITNAKGSLPPLVSTDFYVMDGGNASPRFIRSTMYSIPCTPDLMKQAAIPFGLVISPMANLHSNEAPLYLGTSLGNGPVRCNRCKAYMSTLMMFMDGGRRFQCLLCKQTNEVPSDYYCHMDSLGARADKFQRPELCLGSFEYVATSEYCRDKILPKEPAFIFVLEMTQMMLQRGIISLICQNMREILKNLPVDQVPGQEDVKSKVHVGFITYDSSVHFYKLSGLSPEMCVVCDKEGMFVPVPDGILCEYEKVADNIEKLMESIPQNFQTARETSGNLYGAINAGMAALKASGRAGKLFVFHSSLPHGEGLGKLKSREDRKLLGTDKEKGILMPQNTHYNTLAQDLVSAGCGVDLFLFNEAYIDLATIGQVCKLTGGQCYKYTYFALNKDGPRLLEDLKINIGRNIAFEAVMRVRSSTGVRPVEFYGHFFMTNTHDVELAVVDSSKAVAVEIKHDDKLTEEDGVYIQTALLYTSCGGQRRLRILNLSLNVCTLLADLFKSCDNDTLLNFLAKESMSKFLQTSAKQVKDNLISKAAHILSCYRKDCASPSSVGQLILPELLKLLPLYINCLSRSDALSGGQDLTCDDRSWHIYQLTTMDVAASSAYLYPRLIPLSDTDPQETTLPPTLRTSYDKLQPDGVFLLENGLFMFIWVGSGTSATWMNDVFGVAAPHHLDPVISELPDLDNPVSQRVRGILDCIRKERRSHLRLFVVPQQGKHELVLRNYLVEDKGMLGSPSYVEFLCHIHKEVRAILS